MDSASSFAAFFERTFTPLFLAGASPRTFAAYAETFRHWRRIVGEISLGLVDTVTLAKFRDGLVSRRLSPATVNKHLRHVNHVLGKAGPAGPRNRDALGVLPRCPWVKSLKLLRRRPHVVDFVALSAAYEAARFARWPRFDECETASGLQARDWWRGLYVVAYTTAFRREALFALGWDDVDVAGAIVRLPAEHDKCGVERIKPLHRVAIAHLLRIRTAKPQALLFAWPHGWKRFYAEWHAIQDMAGSVRKDHFTLHDLKRTAGTELSGDASPWVVQQMLDHSSINTSKHYVNAAKQLRPAVDHMPMPEAFLRGIS